MPEYNVGGAVLRGCGRFVLALVAFLWDRVKEYKWRIGANFGNSHDGCRFITLFCRVGLWTLVEYRVEESQFFMSQRDNALVIIMMAGVAVTSLVVVLNHYGDRVRPSNWQLFGIVLDEQNRILNVNLDPRMEWRRVRVRFVVRPESFYVSARMINATEGNETVE